MRVLDAGIIKAFRVFNRRGVTEWTCFTGVRVCFLAQSLYDFAAVCFTVKDCVAGMWLGVCRL